MRTKDEILGAAQNDITNSSHIKDAHLWLDVRKLEVLIDIRDIFLDLKKVTLGLYDYFVNKD